MSDKIEILCTRSLDDSLLAEAAKNGISIESQSFIHTEPITTVEVQQEIENALLRITTVVFTSINAVEVVAEQVYDNLPDWKIYCIGRSTKQAAGKYFGHHLVAGTADSAAGLATLIIEDAGVTDLFFFCGDQRRDEMPQQLRDAGINVEEIVVYQTIATPHKIAKHYKGIMFFSPSAVRSFFSMNKIEHGTVLFSIGETTAAEIKRFTENKILIAAEPGAVDMVKMVEDFFSG